MQFRRLDNPIIYWLAGSVLIGMAGLLVAFRWPQTKEFSKTGKPNIIFLLADDLRFDACGYAGNRIVKTPNIDHLAQQGVRFRNAYATTAICCVSRASILTGQYAQRHGIHDFNTPLPDSVMAQTYPVLLRRAGFYTGFIGKYGIGENREANMPKTAFDVWRGFIGQGMYYPKDSTGLGVHLTDRQDSQIIDFLRNRDKHKPFCLSVSFKAPHVQSINDFVPSPAYDQFYRNVTIPVPPTADARYWQAFPESFRKDNEGRSRWEVRFGTPERFQENVKRYYRLITHLDEVVGHVVAELKQQGITDNTVIVFTSDNGFYLGEYGLADKWYGHEMSIRVPLFIYDPRLPAPKRSRILEPMALNIDLAPTLLGLAGVKPPIAMQGRDLYDLINNREGGTETAVMRHSDRAHRQPKTPWRHEFFYQHLYNHNGRIPRLEGVVGERYKYFRFLDLDPLYEQLFDLKIDPLEIHNQATNPNQSALLANYRKRWLKWRDKTR